MTGPGSLASMDKAQLTDEEWRQRLTPQEYRVLRQAGTEGPFTRGQTDPKTERASRGRAGGAGLFRAQARFESQCGWPGFCQPADGDAVILPQDRSRGGVRAQVR